MSGTSGPVCTPHQATYRGLPRDIVGPCWTDSENFLAAQHAWDYFLGPRSGDFAHCGYGTKYPFSANKTRTVRRERHGKWYKSLIVGMCMSPRGFFQFVLRRKSSVERERQVNWSRIKCYGGRKQSSCRINVSLSVF